MIRINLFNSVTEPQVKATITISECFDLIKYGGSKKSLITEAKNILQSNKSKYDRIKTTLPCVSYSFLFNEYRKGVNILKPTGLIALDIDGDVTLPESKFIYASYLSLSSTGRLILIKAQNLSISNYKHNYELISKVIGVVPDLNASKVTQPFVLPYDSSIYINENSEIWHAKDLKKAHIILEKKERVIGNGLGPSKKRFSNLNEIIANINFEGDLLYDNKNKFGISSIFIPRSGIPEGYRTRCLLGIGFQFRGLNKDANYYDVYNLLSNINKNNCKPPISKKELRKIVKSIVDTKWDEINLRPNEFKRFLFNPDYDLTTKEKQSAVMKAINKDKGKKAVEDIKKAINEWNFIEQGKITQKNLSKVTLRNIKTIKKYYPKFKQEIRRLNKEFKENKRPPP